MQPGAELGALIEAGQETEGAQEGLLHRIFGRRGVAGDAESQAVDRPGVGRDEPLEGVGVAGEHAADEVEIAGVHAGRLDGERGHRLGCVVLSQGTGTKRVGPTLLSQVSH